MKLVVNCETLLFQRPDDAIHRGADKQAEADIASPGTFFSNYEPFTVEQAAKITDHVAEFDKYTSPMKNVAGEFCRDVCQHVATMWFPPRIRAWWTASPPRIRATCKSGPTWRIRAKLIWRKSPRAWSARFPRSTRSIFR